MIVGVDIGTSVTKAQLISRDGRTTPAHEARSTVYTLPGHRSRTRTAWAVRDRRHGLGATKYEELYVLWGAVARRLDEAGLTPVRPEVGELVTSLDMAGCSLTLSWLDDELERLWRAPADTPAFRRGTPREPLVDAAAERPAAAPRRTERSAATASGAAVEVAELAVHALRAARDVLHRDAEALGRLDAVAGDGDHGRGMCKGVDAALAAAEKAHADRLAPAAVLAAAGDAWAAEAGAPRVRCGAWRCAPSAPHCRPTGRRGARSWRPPPRPRSPPSPRSAGPRWATRPWSTLSRRSPPPSRRGCGPKTRWPRRTRPPWH
ncbi:hypothetical protein SANTM175S_05856 [Streptomyces antimycoticus]